MAKGSVALALARPSPQVSSETSLVTYKMSSTRRALEVAARGASPDLTFSNDASDVPVAKLMQYEIDICFSKRVLSFKVIFSHLTTQILQ